MTSGQLNIQPNGTNGNVEAANSNQELLSKGSKKKTTAVIIGIVVLLVVLLVVVFMLKRGESPPTATISAYSSLKRGIPLEAFIAGDYAPQRFNGTWISDTEILYKAKDGSIRLYNARKKSTHQLLTGDLEILKTSFQYELSADRRYLMLAHSYQKLYRHTFLAYYHIVDLESKKDWPVTDVNGAPILLQLVVWSPVGNAFAYVYLNDIYYRPSAKVLQEFRLTHTGRPSTVYNGVPDWVYEEEIFSSNTALWFSKDGQYLAYATFNDSRTPVMNIPYYGVPGDLRFQYTQAVNIRYPKPGRPNPTVALNTIKLADLPFQNPVRVLNIPPASHLKEPVLNLVKWISPSQILVVWMNRVQNKADVVMCYAGNTTCQLIISPEEKSGWVIFTDPLFSSDGSKMAYLYGHDQGGDAGAYRHLTMSDLSSSAPAPVALTKGKFVVSDLVAWDQDSHYIYFLSNVEGSPGERRLNRVPDRLEGAPHEPECVSCSAKILNGPHCSYSGAIFSENNSFYIHTCAGPGIPEIAVFNKKGERIMSWDSHETLKQKLSDKALPTTETLTVPVGGGVAEASVKLFLPPDLDTSGATKYPLMVQVYGGPDTNQVLDRYSIGWHTYLTVNQSIIYAMIDGRGSGLKGNKMLFANYRNLGTNEIRDQIDVTRHLLSTRNYIDKDRTAIWGWSYGGYATGMVLANDTAGVFKCGISVAPVSDWLLYDTIYTERYMGLPTLEDNLRGYEAASLNNKVKNFRKKKFLLIHGTLDDNVHYQQSMMLAKSLELNDILFDQQTYPDEGHGLIDVQPHLYHQLQHFLKKCFESPAPAA